MKTTPPYELAYANGALMLALFDVLARLIRQRAPEMAGERGVKR